MNLKSLLKICLFALLIVACKNDEKDVKEEPTETAPALDDEVCSVWEFSHFSAVCSSFCIWIDFVHLELAGRTTFSSCSVGACTVLGEVNIIAPVLRSSTCMKHVGGIGLFVTIAKDSRKFNR